jgi:hypothetical protein
VPLGERRHDLRVTDWRAARRQLRAPALDARKGAPIKAGETQSGSMYSPTSLSSRRAFVRGSEHSTLCCLFARQFRLR